MSAETRVASYNSEYAFLCGQLGQLTLERETLDANIAAVKAKIATVKERHNEAIHYQAPVTGKSDTAAAQSE